jgi:DNA-binding response OmpR family regulator
MAKILLVDDDKMNGVLLQKRLVKRGFECDYVEGGEECFKAIDQKDSNYSLVLLDIMMPNISGTEVLSKIRETKNNFELPVIMVTAKDEASDVVEALKGGANDYLTKPVNIDIAEARIETQLKIVDLMQESLKGKQMKTIATMVTTLNHEINNPLAIAIGNLSIAQQKMDITRIDKAMSALNRITEIVKKIENISDGNVEETDYSGNISMYKI